MFQFCRPIWRRWIDLALLSGALKLPAGMTRQQAYAVEWVPQAWSYSLASGGHVLAPSGEMSANITMDGSRVFARASSGTATVVVTR